MGIGIRGRNGPAFNPGSDDCAMLPDSAAGCEDNLFGVGTGAECVDVANCSIATSIEGAQNVGQIADLDDIAAIVSAIQNNAGRLPPASRGRVQEGVDAHARVTTRFNSRVDHGFTNRDPDTGEVTVFFNRNDLNNLPSELDIQRVVNHEYGHAAIFLRDPTPAPRGSIQRILNEVEVNYNDMLAVAAGGARNPINLRLDGGRLYEVMDSSGTINVNEILRYSVDSEGGFPILERR